MQGNHLNQQGQGFVQQGGLQQGGLQQGGLQQGGLQQGQGFVQQGGLQQGGLQQGGLQQGQGFVQQGGLQQGGLVHDQHHHHHHHQGQGLVSGIPTTQSTNMTGFNQGEQVLSQVHTGQQQTYVQQPHIAHQGIVQQGYQNVPVQSGGQPLQFSGIQANVLPVGGVPTSVEQYATEALMRGTDPLNTQQHYQYNVVNGSANPGFSGIPMNYSAGNAGNLPNQTPQSLTQTPLYSGSQPLQYEGNEGHAARLHNTHTTGHHNEGLAGGLERKEHNMENKFGQHSTTGHETKNLNTGDFTKH